MSDKAILITGARGFLGRSLAWKLADAGEKVRAFVRPKVRKDGFDPIPPELKHPNVEVKLGDIMDPESLEKAMDGCKQVYHLAALAAAWAKKERYFFDINVRGTVNVLDAAVKTGVQRVLFTSTAGTIGPTDPDGDKSPVGEDNIRVADFFAEYESSKFIAEERAKEYVTQGLDVVIVNPTRVYGPGSIDLKNGVTLLLNQYLYKFAAAIPGNGKTLGNYVHIEDIVDGHLLAMEKGRSGERYLLGGADNITFNRMFELVREITGKKGRLFRIPFWLVHTLARFEKMKYRITGSEPRVDSGFVRKYSFDWPCSVDKARQELGYTPMDSREGLAKTIEWLKKQKKK